MGTLLQPILIGVGILHLLAVVDVWLSRMSAAAKALWTLTLVFMPGVGFAAWVLTRASAHRPLDPIPETPSDVPGPV